MMGTVLLRIRDFVFAERKRLAIGAGLLVLFIGLVWFWRHRSLVPVPKTDQQITEGKAKIEDKARARDAALLKAKDMKIASQDEELRHLKAEATMKAEKPLQDAMKAGPDGLSKLATDWWQPGTLERLKTVGKPQERIK